MRIEDKCLHPYFINFESHNYDVHKTIVPKDTTKNPYNKLVGSKQNLTEALKLIVDAKLKSNKDVVNLNAFITEYRKIKIEIASIVSDDIDTRISKQQLEIDSLKKSVQLLVKRLDEKPALNFDI